MHGPDKPSLVLLHGLGSDASFWDNIGPALDAAFDVRALDLPGHGAGATRLSSAAAHPRALAASIAADLERAGSTRPHVVGLSLGGWVALELAALGRAASVTALAPAGLWATGARIPRERAEQLLRLALGPLDPLLPSVIGRRVVRRVGLGEVVVHPERVEDAQFLAAVRALRLARGYGACDRAAVRNRFEGAARVLVPTTVAFGDADRILPPETSQERSLAPVHARWRTVPDCGHAMTWDQPARCCELIAETVARADPTEPAPARRP